MFRRIAGVIVGMIVGMVVNGLLSSASILLYPPPEGVDINKREEALKYFASLPGTAFLLPLVAHSSGALVAGLVCALTVRARWVTGSIIVGVLFLLAGIANLIMIPHPIWFAPIDLLLYIPAALLGGWLANRILPPAAAAP